MDLAMLLLTLVFGLATVGLVELCSRLQGSSHGD